MFLAYIILAIKKNTIYRLEFFSKIADSFLQIFISCMLWKALYSGIDDVNGVTYLMIVTSYLISRGLSCVFAFDDFAIPQKIWDGSISSELTKPLDLRKRIFFENFGNIVFSFIFVFLPMLIIVVIFFGIIPPYSLTSFLLFLVSSMLGMGILWQISSIVQMLSFWTTHIWSVSTIKRVVIDVLSGTLVPIWFMPDMLVSFIKYTPFYYIYFVSLQIYLGNYTSYVIITKSLMLQVAWLVLLMFFSKTMWNLGKKKIIINGG